MSTRIGSPTEAEGSTIMWDAEDVVEIDVDVVVVVVREVVKIALAVDNGDAAGVVGGNSSLGVVVQDAEGATELDGAAVELGGGRRRLGVEVTVAAAVVVTATRGSSM